MTPSSPPPFTSAEIAAVRSAFLRLIPRSDAFAAAVYQHLFALDPSVRALFSAKRDEQQDKLVQMLALMVDKLDDPAGFAELCKTSGDRHRRYGVVAAHYEVLERAFAAALRETVGPATETAAREEEVLWLRLYRAAAERMIGDEGQDAGSLREPL